MAQYLDRVQLRRFWEQALAEDGADHDITSQVAVDERAGAKASIISKGQGAFAGEPVFDLLREAYANRLTVTVNVADRQVLMPGMLIATITGPLRLLLGLERTLLNFLQRLCGIATLTRQFVDAVAGTRARIYDTRKTLPGWRELDKYAVRCGGGYNHRMGLSDAILVKDNHLATVNSQRLPVAAAEILARAALLDPPPELIEFEVECLEQFAALLQVPGIDVIMLDNFSPRQLRDAVEHLRAAGLRGKVQLEASGGIDLSNVREIAATGVDRISVGAITHSAAGLDINMNIEPIPPHGGGQ